MNRTAFERQHHECWQRAERLLDDLDRWRPRSDDRAEFPALYRRCCHHLALARSRHLGADLEARLNRIAVRGHHHLYRHQRGRAGAAVDFLVAGFPRLVRKEAALFWLASLLFYGPGVGMALLISADPDAIHAVIDADGVRRVEEMYRVEPEQERGSAADLTMFGFYIYNNIGIAFRTYAGGLLLGLGTAFFLTYNGLMLGAIAVHLTDAGHGEHFWTFVVAHGAFELTAIVIAGSAGLVLGRSLVAPGRHRRLDALRLAAPDSLRLVLGAAALLVVAAFVEAFWSSSRWVTTPWKLAAGAACWLGVIAYLLTFGGRSEETEATGAHRASR